MTWRAACVRAGGTQGQDGHPVLLHASLRVADVRAANYDLEGGTHQGR